MNDATIEKNVDISRGQVKWACDKANERTSDYSKFLTGVASVIFGLSPLFKMDEATSIIKIVFIISLFLVIVSLIFGAVHIWLEKNFFDKWTENYQEIFNKWNVASAKEIPVEVAVDFENSMYKHDKTESPVWSLICQGSFLLLGLLGLLVNIFLGLFF